MESQKTVKNFYTGSSQRAIVSFLFYVGMIGGLSAFLLGIATNNPDILAFTGPFIGAFVIGGIQYFWRKNPLITLGQKHLEFKLAPAASRKFIKYSDLESIEITEKHIVLSQKNQKSIKFPYALIDQEQKSEFLASIKEIMANEGVVNA